MNTDVLSKNITLLDSNYSTFDPPDGISEGFTKSTCWMVLYLAGVTPGHHPIIFRIFSIKRVILFSPHDFEIPKKDSFFHDQRLFVLVLPIEHYEEFYPDKEHGTRYKSHSSGDVSYHKDNEND